MTDDEVLQWLTKEERELFNDTGTLLPFTLDAALCSLAETRKALAEFGGDTLHGCPFCSVNSDPKTLPHHSDAPHEPDCIFTTMPRPK